VINNNNNNNNNNNIYQHATQVFNLQLQAMTFVNKDSAAFYQMLPPPTHYLHRAVSLLPDYQFISSEHDTNTTQCVTAYVGMVLAPGRLHHTQQT
jgi:hypothetical protein